MLKRNFATLRMSLVVSLFCCFLFVNGDIFEKKYDEEEGRAYLKKINADIQVKTTESVLASWAYESNITDENLRHQLDVSAKLANYTKEIWKETIKYPWQTFKDPDVRRQFQKFSVLGTAILSPPKYERFNKIISDMQSVYGKAKICNYYNRTDCSMQLEPELTEIFVKSRDPDELRYYWEEWRNVAGKPVRKMYKEYVDLSNEAANLNNFTNNAEFWLKDYEAKDFKQQVEVLWQQVRPLYLQLHAYVRKRLREQYGEKHVTKRGPIPAHLLGNMWAQSWGNVFDFTTPYPGKPSMDVTPNMVEQGYTPLRMFKLAEEFFTSLNLSPMPDTFWKNSILEKPTDGRDLICHASAWDFYDGKDFRIKQCTRVTMEDLNTVHHEMGHIQYFLQYKNQPLVYKEGTNPGFHEAVGDVMALSVSTPKHLRKIGLLNATEDDAESEINQLFNMALDKIAFLPFGYLMDQWRWSVFEGKTTEKDYNCKWWQLREKYQGLSPSVIRTEDDFDPGAKYHTVGNVPYIRYFVSFIIQFQFHRSLCIAAKEFNPNDPSSKPLHKCDIYQSKEAGALLKKMLQMGSSKPWPDAMEVIMGGQRKMDARALLDYFATLQAWLEKENKKSGEFIGWESSQRTCEWEEETEGAKPSDAQGNFEDDNIAYTYAEFVRQDDNSFGFPDYLEEVRPSYHPLRHRQEKKEFHTNYFVPKRNGRKFSKTNNLYLPDGPYLQNQNKFIDVSAPQRPNSRFEKKSVEEVKSQRFPGAANCKIYKVPLNAAFEKRTKRQETKKTKLMEKILKEVQYIKSTPLTSKASYKWISSREAAKDKKNSENVAESKAENNVDAVEKSAVKNDDKEEVKLLNHEEEKVQESSEEKNQDPSPSENNQLDTVEYKIEQIAANKNNEGKPESASDSDKKVIFENSGLYVPNELIWKAEMVKNEAKKMLESYNLSAYTPDVPDTGKFSLQFRNPFEDINTGIGFPPERPSNKKNRNVLPLYNTPEYLKQGKVVKFHLNPFENFLKGAGYNALKSTVQGKKHLHFKEYDLVGVIPVDSLPLESENDQVSDNKKRRSSELTGNSEFTYVMLVGKLSENHLSKPEPSSKKKQKKSYKEYHFNVKTPVIYNAVVITSGGKTDKSDDPKDHWSGISNRMTGLTECDRNLREADCRKFKRNLSLRQKPRSRQKFFKNDISSSVKNNKFNINNIVQYFGCLQILF